MIKKVVHIIIWSMLGTGSIVLLVAAMKAKDEKVCAGVQVKITSHYNTPFISEQVIMQVLKHNGIENGSIIKPLNLQKIEDSLNKNPWIKDVQLFLNNNQVFYATITERTPVARVFTVQGNSFYIDETSYRLPVSDNYAARLPVFTSFPSNKNILSKPDSVVLEEITTIAAHINQDSFLFAQVAQVNITPQHTYEIVPVLGNQIIELGNAEKLNEKFEKLFAFYKQIWATAGFEKYSRVRLQFNGQIVAEKRGAQKPYADTLRAISQQVNAERMLNNIIKDTVYASSSNKVNSIPAEKLITPAKVVKEKVNKKPVIKNEKKSMEEVNDSERETEINREPKAIMKRIN